MRIGFERVGAKRPVHRYLLRFRTAADYAAALGRNERDGYLRFHCAAEANLIGRVVRVSEPKRLIEVEAAADTEPAA